MQSRLVCSLAFILKKIILFSKRATNKQAGAFLDPASPGLPPFGGRERGDGGFGEGQSEMGREPRGGEGVADLCHGRLQVGTGLVPGP